MISRKQFFARGRIKGQFSGYDSKTEKAFAQYLEEKRISGKISRFWPHSAKFRLADRCWIEPDFLAQLPTGELILIDVKGAPAVFMEDAKVKMKVLGEQLPFRVFVAYPKTKREGGGFKVEGYPKQELEDETF